MHVVIVILKKLLKQHTYHIYVWDIDMNYGNYVSQHIICKKNSVHTEEKYSGTYPVSKA